MKRILMCLLLGIWAVAVAQAPPGEEPADGTDSGEQALPCIPASEISAVESEQEDAAPGPVPCEELEPEVAQGEDLDPEVAPGEELDPELALGEEPSSAEASSEIVADPEAIADEDSGTEASAEEEFKPGDEISEDYPVPLPSDI